MKQHLVAWAAAACCTLLAAGAAAQPAMQEQFLLRGVTLNTSAAVRQLNQKLGAVDLRELSSTPGSSIVTVPLAARAAWIEELKQINGASQPTINVTSLLGDYRSLYHRLPGTVPLLGASASRVETLRRQLGNDNVNLVKLAPRSIVREAVTVGFDTRDGFASRGTVSLPLDAVRSVAVTQESHTPTQAGYLWRGRPVDAGASDEAVFVSDGENMTGTVRIGREVFTYMPLGGGVHAVTRQSTADGPPEHPPRFNEKLKNTSNDAPPESTLDVSEAVEIDLLVVFSSKLAAGFADLRQSATIAVDDANKSFADSGILAVSLRSAHMATVPYDEDGPWVSHIDRLTNPQDPVFRSVHQLREQYKADLVVLVVEDTTWCGEAKDINVGPAAGFAVVSRICLLAPRYSFAHELGHLLGARHDRQSDPELTPFRWAHGYVNATKWRTIMSYDVCGGCPRVLRWSNPHLEYAKEPTGSFEYEHDARVWLENARRVSRFR
ncbi:MAG: M12 family metallo-peptidase [Oxalobacteraceae bacterium]|nr:M12 family metallo-peptidase [Oxalobacteraceae bacterium]